MKSLTTIGVVGLKVGGQKVAFFHKTNFPTDDIMDAPNFNFAPKFPLRPNGAFLAPNLVILDDIFLTGRKCCDGLKFMGAVTSVPQCHCLQYKI